MKVYIALTQTQDDPSVIHGVFFDFEDAKDCALSHLAPGYVKCFTDEDFWENGFDCAYVECHSVWHKPSEPHIVSEPSSHEEILESDNRVIREYYEKTRYKNESRD